MKGIIIGKSIPLFNQISKFIRPILVFFGLGFFALNSQAQCTFSCTANPTNPAEFAISDQNCVLMLPSPSAIASADCEAISVFNIEVRDVNTDTLIVPEFTNVAFTESAEVSIIEHGQFISIRYSDANDPQNVCTNFANVMDNVSARFTIAPVVGVATCPTITMACDIDFDIDDIDFQTPTVYDNCDLYTLSVSEAQPVLDCADVAANLTQIYTRQWFVTDTNTGEINSCIQSIELELYDSANIMIPSDITVECNTSTAATTTGFPTLNTLNILGAIAGENSNGCSLYSVNIPADITLAGGTPQEYVIQRSWAVHRTCDHLVIETGTQFISVIDTTEPVFTTCPTTVELLTSLDSSDNCTVAYTLSTENVTVTDNCSDITLTATTSFGATYDLTNNGDAIVNFPLGTQTVTYTATDNSVAQNSNSTCVVTFTVTDDQSPSAICEENTVVSLTSAGTALVDACSFDANNNCNTPASYDDCSPIGFRISLDSLTFTDNITFECSQAGMTLPIYLEVYELVNLSGTTLSTVCTINVTVSDSSSPSITCPSSLEITCEDDYSDLSVYGSASVFENCNFTLEVDSLATISQCGDGTIVRSFMATDNTGNINSCSQTITIVNNHIFDGTGINFPADIAEFNTCRDINTVEPEDFNVNYIADILPDNMDCSMLAVTYDDLFFNINAPSCYKIIRTWTVIDWCSFDPSNPSAGGSWTGIQEIAIMDNLAPILVVPDTLRESVGSDCVNGSITGLLATATDGCNINNITISNDFTTDTDGTANGTYPLGVTDVTFSAIDGCGNTSTATTTVIISDDTKPTLICRNDVVTDLALMGSGGMVMANVDLFVYQTSDNCSAVDDIQLFMAEATVAGTEIPTTTDLAFDCSHEGLVGLEIWAVDQAGNTETCLISLEIQDNNNVCPDFDDLTEATVSGAIQTEVGDNLEDVEVLLSSNSNAFPDMTGFEGSFAFPDLPLGINYTVVPEKDIDDENGVTTWDIILMKRHILGITPLSSPYKIIAADVNNSGGVTNADIIAIKRLILGIDDSFQANNSWRFVDMYYEFENPANPFENGFPEALLLTDLDNDISTANFFGIKVGDVNCSAIANLNGNQTEERNSGKSLIFLADNQSFETGEKVEIEIRAKDFKSISGFQMSVDYPTNSLEFIDMEAVTLSAENFQFNEKNLGKIGISFAAAQGLDMDDETVLFKINFLAKKKGVLSNSVRLSNKVIKKEAYKLDENTNEVEWMDIFLNYTNKEKINNPMFILYQNEPNPFRDLTVIPFLLPEASHATLTVFDGSGKQLYTKTGDFAEGRNEITLKNTDLAATGVVYYQLATATHTATRKMVIE